MFRALIMLLPQLIRNLRKKKQENKDETTK